MEFEKKLIHGKLIKRYKRFLANVLLEEGAEVCLSPVDDPKRKTCFTWEMIRIGGDWVGINTSHPNALAYHWLMDGEQGALS